MALYLVQHGKSLPKDVDPEQGLSDEGIAEVRRIAEIAAYCEIHVGRIKHSTKARAKQTATLLQEAIGPSEPVREMAGLKPLDDVTALQAEGLHDQNGMLVGHLPFMERLTAHLITGEAGKKVIKFQNGGIVCLDRDPETGDWFIKWTLMPNIH